MNESPQNVRYEWIINFLIFLVPVLGILFIFREVIFQSKIFSHLDVLINFVPYYSFLSGGEGLISQGLLSGFPVYVSTNSGWFNPLSKILFSYLDPVDTFRLLDVSYLILAYIFSYLFMRRIKLGHLASILGAAIFIFAGQVMLWSETIIITNYYFILPLSLYFLDLALDSRWLKASFLYILLGLILGWGWVSGHVQFLIYIITLLCVYFAFFIWSKYKEKTLTSPPLVHILFFLCSLCISIVCGYEEISAILDFLPLTARANGVTFDEATSLSYAPHHLIYYLLPYFKAPYVPLSQSFQNYLGILPILLSPLIFLVWKDLRSNKYFNFFLGIFIFCFVASIRYSPVAFVMHHLPFYSSFRQTFRVMFIGDFAFAIVVAISVGYIWQSREIIYPRLLTYIKWLRKLFLFIILPVIALLSIVKIFFFSAIENLLRNYFINNLYSKTVGGYPPEHYFRIINSYLHQSLDQFFIFDVSIIALVICGVSSYFLIKNIRSLSFRNLLIIAVILTVGNFSLIYIERIVGIPKSELLTSPKTALFIKHRESGGEPFRIFSPFMSTTIYNESNKCGFEDLGNWSISDDEFLLRRELIEPNLPILYGLESADGYEPFSTVRTSEIAGYVGSRFSNTDNHALDGEKIMFDKKIAKLIDRMNIFKVLNVKYLLTPFPINSKDFNLIYSDEVGKCKTKLYIYELTETFPRYFLTDRVVSISKNESFLSQMDILSRFDMPTVMIESEKIFSSKTSNYFQKVLPTLNIGDQREFSVDVKKESYFLIGEALLPGWQATLDGVSVPLIKANYIYSAIYLEPGIHNIKLEYKK